MKFAHVPALVCVFLLSGLSAPTAQADRMLPTAQNPSPNGAYILCKGDVPGCYDLRDRYNQTNTQIEHVADRLLLRTGGAGVLFTQSKVLPLSWQAPDGDTVIVRLEDKKHTVWTFKPQGAFLQSPKRTFIFLRSEREFEDTDGGAISIPD